MSTLMDHTYINCVSVGSEEEARLDRTYFGPGNNTKSLEVDRAT
jgi:hypothetical protein